jgi:hypothetical protein
VRSEDKKVVMQWCRRNSEKAGGPAGGDTASHHTHRRLIDSMNQGWIPIIIISSYRIYREKSPHGWSHGYDDKYNLLP